MSDASDITQPPSKERANRLAREILLGLNPRYPDRWADHIVSVLTAADTPETGCWQPAGTAPRSHSPPGRPHYVIVWNGHHMGVGYHCEDEGYDAHWADESGEFIEPEPTHWRPLPDPPHLKAADDLVKRPPGQCSWSCYYGENGRLVRDSACTVHGASSEEKPVSPPTPPVTK